MVWLDRSGLTALIAKQALFSLVDRSRECAFHERELSINSPKNLVLLMSEEIEAGTMVFKFTLFCCLVINCKKCVLLRFNGNRLL
jgi:hypothetical protein